MTCRYCCLASDVTGEAVGVCKNIGKRDRGIARTSRIHSCWFRSTSGDLGVGRLQPWPTFRQQKPRQRQRPRQMPRQRRIHPGTHCRKYHCIWFGVSGRISKFDVLVKCAEDETEINNILWNSNSLDTIRHIRLFQHVVSKLAMYPNIPFCIATFVSSYHIVSYRIVTCSKSIGLALPRKS